MPEPDRVRPYVIAEELRREWRAAQHPDPAPDPVPDPPPDPELPRRVPGEHAPPPLDPRLAAPAASPAPPSAQTLQHVLHGLQSLDVTDEPEDPPTLPPSWLTTLRPGGRLVTTIAPS